MASAEEQQLLGGFRGYAVLISNEEFLYMDTPEDPTRKGADKDDTNLQYIFNTKLGFQLLDKRTYMDVNKEPLKSNVSKAHWIHNRGPENESRLRKKRGCRPYNEICPCSGHDNLQKNERCPCPCITCKIQTTDHSKSEYFVLAISTHGVQVDGEQELVFSDDYNAERVKLSDIIKTLNDENCKTLKGKTRIILLQLCRSDPDVPKDKQAVVWHDEGCVTGIGNLTINEGNDRGTEAANSGTETADIVVEEDEVHDPDKEYVYGTEEALRNLPSNFLIIFPTVSGKKTWHNFDSGSWLIEELREVVENFKSTDMNFLTVLTITAGNIARKKESKEGYKCAVCIVHRLLRPIIFRGIRDTGEEQAGSEENSKPAL